MNADEAFEKISRMMLTKFLERNPDFATLIGLHEPHDHLLPTATTEHIMEDLRIMEETVRRLNSELKREELNDQHKIDLEILERACERWKFVLREQRIHELNPDAFLDLGGVVFVMFTRDYAPLEKRVDAIAARIEKMPKYLEEFRTRFEKSQPVKLWVEMAIETAQSMGGLFQFILHATKDKVSASIYERLSKASENLQIPLKQHMEWLQSLLPKATEEWALGKDKYERLIKLRALGMTSEEIYQLGVKYLDELKAERRRLAQKIAPGKSPEEVMKMIESKAPKSFDEALEYTQKTIQEAKKFVQEKNIATIYSEDVLLVKETPAFLAPLIPFAAMMLPARFDKQQIGIYLVTRPKDLSNLGKHLNFASVKGTAVHEAFPGHFLQGTISNRGSVLHIFAQAPETAEGWAHYCEQMMVEKGFIKDLESRFMQVNSMIWRAIRVIVDVKLSRREMSFEEAVDMLVKETAMSKEGAIAEVKHYTQDPGQPLSYLIGRHLMQKLKEEVKQKMGSDFEEKMFNDTITANGFLPMILLRKVFEQKIGKMKA